METEEQKTVRVQRCLDRVKQVLAEEHCRMEPKITLTGTGLDPECVILPNELPKEESKEEPKDPVQEAEVVTN